jgi:pyruvate dehydrogenase E2 component (dihydrolipoamide acetyltransferase)
LSPVVRKLISENGLEANAIPGTGMGGRITRDDVLNFLDTRGTNSASPAPSQAPAPMTAPAPVPANTSPAPAPGPAVGLTTPPAPLGVRDEVIPFTAIRRVTAEHMVRSKATSAHTLVAREVDFESVDRVRKQYRDRFKAEEGVSLTYLPFITRAVVDVLRDYPHLNSSVGDNALIIHRDIHMGYAVDLGTEGLIVPVVHNVDGQSLRGISRSIADVANRARSRKLSTDDIAGGTFTITNPGPYGTYLTFPIIAQPQVAILSTDGVKRKPVVVTLPDGSESIAIHSVGILALSFDHRAVDGGYAAMFMRDLANVIETRDWAAEL